MNYRAHLQAMRSNRDGWMEILAKNPDSVQAAQYILRINTEIEFVTTLKHLDGDYDE